jgi:uncharacterized membrane protein (DUF4010 family)
MVENIWGEPPLPRSLATPAAHQIVSARGFEDVDVSSEDFHVLEALGAALCVNVFLLRLAVGDTVDGTAGVVLCQP